MNDKESDYTDRSGWAYPGLFPLIGKRVIGPRGPGTLLAVFACQCEVWSGIKGDPTYRVKPDQIRRRSGEQLVTHKEQERVDQYMEQLARKHAEQRKFAKERQPRKREAVVTLLRENCWHCQGIGLCSCIWCWPQNRMLDFPVCAKCQKQL